MEEAIASLAQRDPSRFQRLNQRMQVCCSSIYWFAGDEEVPVCWCSSFIGLLQVVRKYQC